MLLLITIMIKEKKIAKNIKFTERHLQMAQDIAEKEGWTDFTAVIHACLAFKHSKTMPPDYILNRSSARHTVSGAKGAPTAADVAIAKVRLKSEIVKAEHEAKENVKTKICTEVFKGKVFLDASGAKVCKFVTRYANELNDKEQQIPLLQCDPSIAKNNLFVPTKEAVLKVRPELKKIYG